MMALFTIDRPHMWANFQRLEGGMNTPRMPGCRRARDAHKQRQARASAPEMKEEVLPYEYQSR